MAPTFGGESNEIPEFYSGVPMIKSFHNELALVAKIFDIDITPITKQWYSVYQTRLSNRGKADAVRFCKELNSVGERYALRQNITAIPWTKSDNDNFPLCISKFKTYLRSKDSRKVVMALSVLRSCELLRLPISKDISTIIEPCKFNHDLVQSIIDFIPQWVLRLKRISLRDMKYHFTLKNGPNGHALHASNADILAVVNDVPIFEAIRKIEKTLNDDYPMRKKNIKNEVRDGIIPIHSKLCQFPEKSGKTRTIAIIDYYSQRCLNTLHSMLMQLLSTLVSDGTYSHQNVGKYAQSKTKDKTFIYCADLTAFTDRFPAVIQEVLLHELLEDKDLAQAYWTLLAERTFTVAWSGEQITYNCGQPMGAYGSWPLCSLAHHLLVEYSAFTCGIDSSKHLYRMIGDDVIITDKSIAKAYERNINLLGVDINLSKTVCSPELSDYSGAEVAKQLFLNGTCLTPMTPGFIRNLRKPYMFNTCMIVLSDRYEFFRPEHPPLLIDRFYRKNQRRKVWMLCSNPINGWIKPGYPGYDLCSPWISKDIELKKKDFHTMVVDQLLDKATRYAEREYEQLVSGEDLWKDPTQPPARCLRYIKISISKQLTKAMDRLGDISIGESPETLFGEFDFIPDPTLPYMERKEMRQKRISSAILSLFDYEDNTTFVKLDW